MHRSMELEQFWLTVSDGTERPIAFASRTLSDTEKKYSQVWHVFLELGNFIVTCMVIIFP